jgi:ABC-type polysaccharide/polyol phosphate transport system ATPase subunit
MPDAVITVEGLGKKYQIDHQPERGRYKTLRETITEKASRTFDAWRSMRPGSLPSHGSSKPTSEEFWALRDVSFQVNRGEVVGIIGRNGAGKSTLLKILSRITEPTTGRARICGRVASLLEVGTGFHPELTGRENIFLNGAILGMSKAEIRRKFDEIVAFAEVERFLDTPVKRYSSGMYVRLAFAVAAHLEPEILIVDEVLAVGDAQFQKKCLGKMKEVAANQGRTVLFVSHQMEAIHSLTQRCLYLKHGRSVLMGPTQDCITTYLYEGANPSVYTEPAPLQHDRVTGIRVISANGGHIAYWGEPLTIQFEIYTNQLEKLHFSFQVYSSQGRALLHLYPPGLSLRRATSTRPRYFEFSCHIPKLRLYQDTFYITTWLSHADSRKQLQHLDRVVSFSVTTDNLPPCGYPRKPDDCVYIEDHSFCFGRLAREDSSQIGALACYPQNTDPAESRDSRCS